jgi:hypothetical protein
MKSDKGWTERDYAGVGMFVSMVNGATL